MNGLIKHTERIPIENLDISEFITEENDHFIKLMLPFTIMPDIGGENRDFLLAKFREVELEMRPEWGIYRQLTCFKK